MALPALAQREAIFLAELDRRGYNPAQKAAIMGSVRQESGFNPWAKEKGGTGVGLFQWSDGRAAKVPKFTGDYATDVAAQLKLFGDELAGSERKAGEMLKGATDLKSAAAAMKQFERYGVAGSRYDFMNAYAKRLGTGELKPAQIAQPQAGAAGSPQTSSGFALPAALEQAPAAGPAIDPVTRTAIAALTGEVPAGAAAALAGSADSGVRRFAMGLMDHDPIAAALIGAAATRSMGQGAADLGADLAQATAAVAPAAAAAASAGALGKVAKVVDPSKDIFPTTGAHLDVRVLKGGQYINPETARSVLQNLHVGGKPLYSQQGDQWVVSAPITSRFGPRRAPAPGASSFHRGIDIGVGAGTDIAWMAPGTLRQGHGYRSIQTPEGYEIKLLHTTPYG